MLLGLSSPLKHDSPQEWAANMKKIGCGSIVFPVNCNEDEEKIRAYAEAAKSEDLVIAEVGVWNNMLSSDSEEREKNVDYAIRQLKMADRIGAVCCVNIAGTPTATRWDGAARDNFNMETWEKSVKTIQYVIDEANPKSAKFAIESMPWMIPSGPEEYMRLINDVDRPQFGVHLDIVNMITDPRRYFYNDEFLRKCFLLLRGRICSCHLKDVRLLDGYTFQLQETACGKGSLDLKLYMELADIENPNMPMIIEHLDTDEEYLQSLKYMQNLYQK